MTKRKSGCMFSVCVSQMPECKETDLSNKFVPTNGLIIKNGSVELASIFSKSDSSYSSDDQMDEYPLAI